MKKAKKIQRMQNSNSTTCQILIKRAGLHDPKLLLFINKPSPRCQHKVSFCQSTLARARDRGPEADVHMSSTPATREVTFGPITRNTVLRTQVIRRFCSTLQGAAKVQESHVISGCHHLGQTKKKVMRSNKISFSTYWRPWMMVDIFRYYHHLKGEKSEA